MRVEFINASGGKMLVDESRVDEYIAAGYLLAANVVDSTCVEIIEDVPEVKKKRPRKKEV